MHFTKKTTEKILIGNKVMLLHTTDPSTELKCGDLGTISHIDDIGTVFVNWENGSKLGMIPGEDQFAVFFTKTNN